MDLGRFREANVWIRRFMAIEATLAHF